MGNEGAGTVVAAGPGAEALEGSFVGMLGGGMYTQYRKLKTRDVVPLPEGASAADGASMFVNPLTALGFVETMKMEGTRRSSTPRRPRTSGRCSRRSASPTASRSLNIVAAARSRPKSCATSARPMSSTARMPISAPKLVDAIAETEATIAFDAIGGGSLGSDIVQAMEQAANRNMKEYSRYGSNSFKQLYIYGALDLAPTTLNRLAFGFQWSVSGWLLTPFMQRARRHRRGPPPPRPASHQVVRNMVSTIGCGER
ncbi:hypothetical protein AB5I41_03410 [Sphingomonas sp. MMS24-JH45]